MATTYKTTQIQFLPTDDGLDGAELIPIQDNGVTKRTTVQAIVDRVGLTDALKAKVEKALTEEDANRLGYLKQDDIQSVEDRINENYQSIATLQGKIDGLPTKENINTLSQQVEANRVGIVELTNTDNQHEEAINNLRIVQATKQDANQVREIAQGLVKPVSDRMFPKDGSVAMEADLKMGANKILNVGTPTLGTDATNKTYVDSAIQTAVGNVSFNGDMKDQKIINLQNPTDNQDAVNKRWADHNFLSRANAGTMLVDLNMDGKKVIGLGTPTANTDAATKAYVDSKATAPLPTNVANNQTIQYVNGEWKAVDFTYGTLNYVGSRGPDFITNGTAFLKNNYNFSKFVYDPTDAYSGYGCFKITGINNDVTLDEVIPIDYHGEYEFSFAIKSKGTGGKETYAYVSCLDIDGEVIGPHHVKLVSFRLGAPLNPGDTTITVHADDRTAFQNVMTTSRLGQAVDVSIFDGNYTSKGGFMFPTGSYSRKQLNSNVNASKTSYDRATGVWSGFNFNLAGFTTALPEGHTVIVGMSGGTYIYWVPDLAGAQIADEWTIYRTRIRADDTLRPWTALVKVGFLCNRKGTENTTGISNVSMRRVEGTKPLRVYQLADAYLPSGMRPNGRMYAEFYPAFIKFVFRVDSSISNGSLGRTNSSKNVPSGFMSFEGAHSTTNLFGVQFLMTDSGSSYMNITSMPPFGGRVGVAVIPRNPMTPIPSDWVRIK